MVIKPGFESPLCLSTFWCLSASRQELVKPFTVSMPRKGVGLQLRVVRGSWLKRGRIVYLAKALVGGSLFVAMFREGVVKIQEDMSVSISGVGRSSVVRNTLYRSHPR